MTFDVMVNGRALKVVIEPAGEPGKITVTIKGKSRVVDASWVDTDTLSLLDAGMVREVRFHARQEAGAIGVETGGRVYETIASNRGTGATDAIGAMGAMGATDAMGAMGATGATGATGAVSTSAPDSAASVKAPMPGRIVRVLVGVGDRVTARQPVVVVEAMKMENELRSPRDGFVTQVLVTPGAAVESGAVLIVVGS